MKANKCFLLIPWVILMLSMTLTVTASASLPSDSSYCRTRISEPSAYMETSFSTRKEVKSKDLRATSAYSTHPVFVQLKTNTFWILTGTLNLGIEVQVDPKCSIDIPVTFSPYDMGSNRRKWRILSMQPEARWWWQKRAGEGQYAGIHLSVAGFNIAFKGTERYQDPQVPAVGLGLSYGYSFRLDANHRWWMDLNGGLGFIHYRYDKFDNAHNGRLISSGSGMYWGVTRLSVGISYRWTWHHSSKWYKKMKKGGAP